MLIRTLSRRIPLPTRILSLLQRHKAPCHYTTIAQRLHVPPLRVQQTCHRMAQDGRLRWCGEGLYALPAPQDQPKPRPPGPATAVRPKLTHEAHEALRLLCEAKQPATLAPGLQQRARMILLLAEGQTIRAVADATGMAQIMVYRWVRRWHAEGLPGLQNRKPGRPALMHARST